MLNGTKNAMIAASNAATSDKNVGFGITSPSQFNQEKLSEILGNERKVWILKFPSICPNINPTKKLIPTRAFWDDNNFLSFDSFSNITKYKIKLPQFFVP
ncbi:MAG: hypothetical protein XD75_0233 [Parcubacteria bacterium 33_209]|jgi:hypothetical protein|nr:MAG: hypothetical protein XD75_0233 [Parcubacteria bacterium 33_209]